MNRLLFLSFCLLSLVLACWAGGGSESASDSGNEDSVSQEEAYRPVSIQNFNRTLTFNERPERVVSMNVHTTEILFSLGLEDYIVGTAFNNAEILPEFKARFDEIPILAERYPSLEVLLGAEPDFVYGRDSAFGSNGPASVEELADFGILSYAVKGTLVNGASMDDVYEDFLNLGRIFGVEDRALQVVTDMQQDLRSIQDKVQDYVAEREQPLRVLVFDAGGDTVFTAGQSLQTTLIELAGGRNIFDDIARNWARVSWEEAVDRDPEVIVINDYGSTPAENKIAEILNNPAMNDVTAVRNERFVVLPLPSVFEGPRNVMALETLAFGFYPQAFE